MRCDYCYSPPSERIDMSDDIALQCVEFISQISTHNTGIIFFGGEPLLKKDLVIRIMEMCKALQKNDNLYFHYKITTNGMLLDEEFIRFATNSGLIISISHDGIKVAHDRHRKTVSNLGTFDALTSKIDLLLSYQPYSPILMAVTPDTVQYYAESVEYLFNKGVKYLVVSLNYAGAWTDSHMKELKRQYKLLARLYAEMTIKEKKFYFSPFEIKLATHIQGNDALCHRCHLAQHQFSVAPDGRIYPCVQFVKDSVSNKRFSIGNVKTGFDEIKREKIYQSSQKKVKACRACALKKRCNNNCSCLNWQSTGSLNEVSPVLCESERLIIPIVDRLGEKLFSQKIPLFIQKHYNAIYPILSLLDDINPP
jgi:uncharacterized protein